MTTPLMDRTILSNTAQEAFGPAPAAASWVDANDEMRVYLQELMEHERTCDAEDCGVCESAHNVYQVVRSLVFSEIVYPDVAIAARGWMVDDMKGTAPTATFSISRAA